MPITINGASQPKKDLPLSTLVQLDTSTSGSSYVWTMLDRPSGSSAVLSDSGIKNPTFTPDVTGTYLLRCVIDATTTEYALAAVQTLRSAQRIIGAGEGSTEAGGPLAGARSWAEDGNRLLRFVDRNINRGSIEIVQNDQGGDLVKGNLVFVSGEAVLASGLTEEHIVPQVKKADASTPATLGAVGMVLGTAGLTADTIPDGDLAAVVFLGIVTGLNTSAFSSLNDPVFATDTPGVFGIAPGTERAIVGYVTKIDAADGSVEMTPGGGGGGSSPFDDDPGNSRITPQPGLESRDFVVGSYQLDDTGNPAFDRRMFFDKSKGAFRAGGTPGALWDAASVGTYSIGLGQQVEANNYGSVAIGAASIAGKYGSLFDVVLGYGSIAQGGYSAVLGYFGNADGPRSVVLGAGRTYGSASYGLAGPGGKVWGAYASAIGKGTQAYSPYSHAEGYNTIAGTALNQAYASHVEGYNTLTQEKYAHAEGWGTKAGRAGYVEGIAAHAEGKGTYARGTYSHAEGDGTTASGQASHAEGSGGTASGQWSHKEGGSNTASGGFSHAEGNVTQATANGAHAEGVSTIASGLFSHAEGDGCRANSQAAHAEGSSTRAYANFSHAEGQGTYSSGTGSHSEGINSRATASAAHAEGWGCYATLNNAHAEGASATASGSTSHAEGYYSQASGSVSHAEGWFTKATANNSHAEGNNTKAYAQAAHAEGLQTQAGRSASISYGCHAEGVSTYAVGFGAHAEGESTSAGVYYPGYGAYGDASHAEGKGGTAFGYTSHAEGYYCQVTKTADSAHAEGQFSRAEIFAQHAQASNKLVTEGDAQLSRVCLQRSLTISTPTPLFNGPRTGVDFPTNKTFTFRIEVAARVTGAGGGETVGKSAAWFFTGLAKDIGGTVSVVGVTPAGASAPTFSDFAGSPTVQIIAGTNRLDVQVVSIAGATVHWSASAHLTEVA